MKVFLKVFPILIIVWYTFALLLPKLSGGTPAIPSALKAYMYKSAGKTYNQVKAGITGVSWGQGKYGYNIELTKKGSTGWRLSAKPKEKIVYKKSFIKRIIWLDFRTNTLPDLHMENNWEFPKSS